ncbi:hypothetical protein C1645_698280 [Glomus cerebriforme]|uniref:Uncharacterized protein n=1 Tax=Glomus cerebriforme TaxID=658196 RepID=A0A397SPR6_9GLOM|nr:hypothetical protein C1645_698280 [Glomus cerebriforme]
MGIERKKTISENIACTWLKHFGWKFHVRKKDVYYNDHERPDVIEYRKHFLNKIFELEKRMPKPLNNNIIVLKELILNVNKKCHILITHDKFTFYANDEKKTFWRSVGHQPLQKKGVELSLHISDFFIEVDRYLKTKEKKHITEKTIPIFEELHPSDVGVFAFDNITSHAAYVEDALIAL